MYDTLAKVRADIADRLSTAASSRKCPMHTPVVVTGDADARIMVLREFNPEDWTLRFHTDARSPKAEVIAQGAPMGVLFYDAPGKVQIRIRGTGRIETDTAIASAAWEESTPYARRCYLGAPPGEARSEPSSGLPEWIEGRKPTEDEVAPVRENFAVLLVQIEEADWYWLSNDGHRRAIFQGDAGRWVTP